MPPPIRRLFRQLVGSGLLLTVLSGAAVGGGPTTHLKDDFETGPLAAIWSTVNLPPGALRFISAPTRNGRGALEITLRPGARADVGRDRQAVERAELREAPAIRLQMGREAWYAFSFWLPPDFPIVDNRLVIAHWKQACRNCRLKRSPMLALRYRNGVFQVDVQRRRGKRRIFSQAMDLRNQWVDMAVHIRPAWDEGGGVQVWKNGRLLAAYEGALGYADDKREIYFKMGLYRDRMRETMRNVLDRFRRGDSYVSVAVPSVD